MISGDLIDAPRIERAFPLLDGLPSRNVMERQIGKLRMCGVRIGEQRGTRENRSPRTIPLDRPRPNSPERGPLPAHGPRPVASRIFVFRRSRRSPGGPHAEVIRFVSSILGNPVTRRLRRKEGGSALTDEFWTGPRQFPDR